MILRGMDETLKKIKQVILETARKYGIEVDRIILFGSRARGDYRDDSDWDILVVTREEYSKKKILNFIASLKIELAKREIPNDIVVKGRRELEKDLKYRYTVSYSAVKEGVTI